ncbi:transcription antitermination factor NusB [Mesomycoplasma molare]|uniref:Transcription antitermination protein NusB n=1 Tax=Mesomycoplasma molare TaxID=171288 RepID=A0ABY5TTB2_9BACT|nr:transcription antitermination factor NusB [Mesomycoplasma molare]UWD33904.1 transcription antitermination protein NusB [Mesomycoplasma molare]
MEQKVKNHKTRRVYREEIISVIYPFELQDIKLDSNKIFDDFDLDNQQIKTIEFIEKHYDFFKNIIIPFLSENSNWNKIKPLIRSILLLGVFELNYLDKKIVINEFVEITKDFTLKGDKDFKLVNAILDKVSKYYEENLTNSKN